MKKIFPSSIVLIFLTSMFNQNLKAQAVTGNYCPAYTQSQSLWCWAACSEMIYWCYKSGFITQCNAAQVSKTLEFNTGCNNLANNTLNACSSPSTYNNAQALFGCTGSVQGILSHYDISSTSYNGSFTAATLTTAMSARKMLIARWARPNGHFVVVNRFKGGYVYYNDPQTGAMLTTYNNFKTANGLGTWTHTLRMNNASTYGSTYNRQAEPTDPKEISGELTVNTYPNPATDKINILLNGEKTEDSKITITDAVGKIVFNQQYTKETNSVAIDIASWSRGIYFVNVNNNKNLSKTISLR